MQPELLVPKNPTPLLASQGPAAPSSRVPLEPTPPVLSGEGALGPPYEGPKWVCQGPSTPGASPAWLGLQPPVYLLSELYDLYDPPGLLPWAQPRPLSLTPLSSGVSEPRQYQAPAASILALLGREGVDVCPAGVLNVTEYAHHTPGLEGVLPLQFPVPRPPGSGGRGQQEPM